jgi:GNAT superfamily N-acetyltransferase
VTGFFQSRPYRVIEFNNVLARRILPDEPFDPVPGAQPVLESDIPLWSQMISEAFSEYMPVSAQAVELLAASCKSSICWLAGDPTPEAGAAMGIQNGVALFYGDATLVSARRKGWQSRLIRARLADAQHRGCDLAMVSVLPGSASHRNYERAGFQLIYMRVNLSRGFED